MRRLREESEDGERRGERKSMARKRSRPMVKWGWWEAEEWR